MDTQEVIVIKKITKVFIGVVKFQGVKRTSSLDAPIMLLTGHAVRSINNTYLGQDLSLGWIGFCSHLPA